MYSEMNAQMNVFWDRARELPYLNGLLPYDYMLVLGRHLDQLYPFRCLHNEC